MYIPKSNLFTDQAEIVAFMRQFSFATLVTAKNNMPVATHLPLVVEQQENELLLTGHFAKANPQWQELTANPVLAIFNEPHAYISPRHYEKEQNVPTWNYVAVHAYGEAKIIEDTTAAFAALEQMIQGYEPEYLKQWQHLPQDYKHNMLRGIVPFEIKVTDLQAKEKLSQNKTKAEQQRIIQALSESEIGVEKQIAAFMQHKLVAPESI